MLLSDEEAAQLKTWVVKKLEDISDADSDVLADYVLALIRADSPEQELKKGAIENLEDFLRENTATFVDELFAVINAKSYVPGYVPPQTKPLASPSFQAPPATSATFPAPNATTFNGPPQQARKRSYNESNDGGNSGGYGGGDRQIKQMRRSSGRGGRDDAYSGRGGRGGYHPPPVAHNGSPPMLSGFPSNMPLPPPPPGASFDDPMAAIMAMQAMGLPPLPGMPALPPSGSPPPVPPYGQGLPGTQAKNKINARCRDYDTKGICTRGVNCPFIHENSIVMPDQEYDPKNAVMTDVQMSPTTPKGLNFPLSDPHTNGHNHTHGPHRGRGRGDRGGYNPGRRTNRAEFSSAGPNSDRSITTIVVEQIPEENFSESSVRSFFSQFGTIESVDMQAYKRLALVKFSDYASANRAHQSPKVIFDNRFVKVFWYKPPPASSDPNPSPTNGKTPPAPTSAEPDFDKEKFARDAEAAQKKHEEKQALLKDAESKRQALEKQQEELARRQAEEKRKLQEKLAAKGQASPPSEQQTNGTTNGDKDENVSAQTKALRAQVAALEAEARSLGLDHALTEDPWSPQRGRGRGRGRGSYRGWEGFAGRGSYAPRGRGSYRGRGGVSAAGYNLDLRPKKVAVGGVEWTGERDEALRQYLLGLGEYNSIDPTTSSSQLIISFKTRAEAETFYFGTRDIPSVGKVEMSWVSSNTQPPSSFNNGGLKEEGDTKMEGMNDDGDRRGAGEGDFDVAEEEDFDVAS